MAKKLSLFSLLLLSIVFVNAQKKVQATKATATVTAASPFKNSLDSFSYAAGMSIGQSLKQSGAEKINTVLFTKAINDVYANGKTLLTGDQANITLQQKLQAYSKKKADAEKAVCTNFLAENKKKKGIIALPNGLQYEILKAGEIDGLKPKAIDTVVVNYAGTLINGTEFDNSYKRGQAATFPLSGVIKGWTEILQLMTKGAKWKVFIPSELGYGANPPQGASIPPNALLIFEISLEDIKPAITATK